MKARQFTAVSRSLPRVDGHAKVTGAMKFGDDVNLYRQLYAKTVYTRIPKGTVKSVNIDKACKVAGVAAVITQKDVPGKPITFGRFPVIAGKEVRYIGDALAVVAAESSEIAAYAASLVEVEYEEVGKPITDIEEAASFQAAQIHADAPGNLIDHASHHLEMGDADTGLSHADMIVERHYRTGFVDNGYIEPEAVIAEVEINTQTVVIRGTIQNPYNIRSAVAGVLGYPLNRIRVIQTAIGGSFGGKDESMIALSCRASILALKTGRPVKMVFTREESFICSPKRHPFHSSYRAGLAKDGKITAIASTHYVQGGPYNKQAMFANWRASIHAAGPYRIPHVDTNIHGVYTNTIFGGAYRGFSSPQVVFAVESLIDECSELSGMNPREFRMLNCLQPWDTLPTGQQLSPERMPANLSQLIEAVCRKTSFDEKWEQFRIMKDNRAHTVKRGIGLSATFRGVGLGGEGIDTGSASVTIDSDGYVQVTSGFTEMGQGLATSLSQIAAEEFGIDISRITWNQNDTSANMDNGPTVASRGIVSGGNAVVQAARKLKKRMAAVLCGRLGCRIEDVEFADSMVRNNLDPEKQINFSDAAFICLQEHGISLYALGWHSPGPQPLDHKTGRGEAYPSYLFGATVAEIAVDTGTGKITAERITSAIELGRAVNPQIVRGQFIGGAIQGLGFAVMEEMDCSDGYMHTLNFNDFMIPGAMDIPEIDIMLFETDEHLGPYGAKGIGEIGIEMIAPAVANAYANAVGKRIRELPLNLERALAVDEGGEA